MLRLLSKMTQRRQQCGQLCLLLSGILLISIGAVLIIYLESIYEFILNDALKFTPTSEPFRVWRKNDPPLDMDIYIFNWTNSEDLKKPEIKPHFEEIGPYRFKEIKEKMNLTWNNNNSISYRIKKSYYFDRENSARDMNEDFITTINPVPLTAAYRSRNANFFSKVPLSVFLSSQSDLIVTKTTREFLFDGFDDGILSLGSKVPFLGIQDKFGIFYGANETISKDGVFTMYTKNDDKFGKLLSWNGKNRTNFYDGHCGEIKGSAMEFYPLGIKKTKLVFFSSELCKYAELEYQEEVTIKGVRGYRFIGDNIFDNGTTRPENSCFCRGDCIPSGVLNVSACRQNSASFLSFPHFYNADPYYRDSIEGMKPNKSWHEFYIVIEPHSGIIMELGANMQLNFLLQPISGIRMYSDVPKIFIPIFYFTQKVELKDSLAANLRIIQSLPEYANYASLIFLCSGTLLMGWGMLSIFCCSKWRENRRQQKEKEQMYKLSIEQAIPMTEKPNGTYPVISARD